MNPSIASPSSLYPFGMLTPGRTWSAGSEYRFGFQNQESDDEISGEGNTIAFNYRMYDSRIGRFFSIDPLTMDYPWNSPYNFSENRVIDAFELEGLESVELNNGNSLSTGPIEPGAQIEKFENSLFNDGNNYITSYGGGKVLEPVVITPNGSEGSLVNFKYIRLNNWEDAPNREPYDGVFGVLDYVFNGGQEGSILYNIKGEPIGPAAIGGAGAAGWIGGPKNPTKIISAAEGVNSVIKGFTRHAAAESAITRGFRTADILKIGREGTQEVIRNGTQIRYTLQSNSIVVQQTGRNAGKVVTVFSNAPGTAKGLGKGFFIPWK
ncbi:MAG: hypothetical protein KA954_09145 [Chitinophagales bacterium]|nr:hypothetical protein [Chitinophagales bacterium]